MDATGTEVETAGTKTTNSVPMESTEPSKPNTVSVNDETGPTTENIKHSQDATDAKAGHHTISSTAVVQDSTKAEPTTTNGTKVECLASDHAETHTSSSKPAECDQLASEQVIPVGSDSKPSAAEAVAPEHASEDTSASKESGSDVPAAEKAETDSSSKEQGKSDGKAADDRMDPYAYTSRGEFTSENFKIEVRNMPRYYGIAQFKKFLTNQLNLNVHKLKPLPGRGAGVFVTLRDEPSRQAALKALDKCKWKKAVLTARPAAAIPDPLLQQRQKRQLQETAGGDGKRARTEEQLPPLLQRTKDAVVPWWNVSYSSQLGRKLGHCKVVVADYKRQLRKINFPLFRWLEKNAAEMDSVRPSPETEHYRNKCEFTVGFHPETNERVVGFRLASYAKGSAAVAPLDDQPQVSERMRKAAGLFEQHVRASEYAPFNAVTHEGHWRQLLVRTTRGGDLLMSAAFHPQELTEDQLSAARESLRQFMVEGPGREAGVTSLHWQSAGRQESGVEQPHQLLSGAGHVTETLCGLQFRISPSAFFQVNSAATEVLYDTIGECAALDRDTTLLDVCCGTGSIGLALAARARAVVGVELVPSAVADARANADRNGVGNCKFFAGRAEALLKTVLEKGEVESGRCVAVVDPPRAGLGREVTQTLRRTEHIKRVVFVACDLKQALKNLLDLGRPESKQYVGYPFVVRRVVPVDLFPHTPHIEVVVLLERCDPDLWRQMDEAKVCDTAAAEEEKMDEGEGGQIDKDKDDVSKGGEEKEGGCEAQAGAVNGEGNGVGVRGEQGRTAGGDKQCGEGKQTEIVDSS